MDVQQLLRRNTFTYQLGRIYLVEAPTQIRTIIVAASGGYNLSQAVAVQCYFHSKPGHAIVAVQCDLHSKSGHAIEGGRKFHQP